MTEHNTIQAMTQALERSANEHIDQLLRDAYQAVESVAKAYNVREVEGFSPTSTLLNLMTEKPGARQAYLARCVADLTEAAADLILSDNAKPATSGEPDQKPARRAKKKAAKRASAEA